MSPVDTTTRHAVPDRALEERVIEPRGGWQVIDWRELRQYRDLFQFLVWRDILVLYKQTILGFAWAIIRPVFSTAVFSVVFGRLARVPSDGIPYPLFSMAGLVPWTYFSSAMLDSSNSVINSVNLLTKVYFPRLVIPWTPVMAKLPDFAISVLVLIAMMVHYRVAPGAQILLLPLLVALMVLTAGGVGMWLSAMSVQFRDVRHAAPFLVQLLMYGAPVVWPASLVPAEFRVVYGFYPMVGVIEGFRAALLNLPIPWDLIAAGSVSAVAVAVTGALYYRRMERLIADIA